jgi:hypothetical protein
MESSFYSQCHRSRRSAFALFSLAIGVTSLFGCMAAAPMSVGAGGLASSNPSAIYAAAAPVPVVQPVVEPTDAQMSCAQLAVASNSMDQVIASESAAARPAPSASFSDAIMHTAASIAAGALSSYAPNATYLAPAATGLEQQQITQQEWQAQAQGQVESQAQMAINNAQQRKMYLATLMQQKNCYAQANVSP